MKISYNWIKQFVDINYPSNKIAKDFENLGHEVEHIYHVKNDDIFHINITSNRGDCLSILGLARELCAVYNKQLNINKFKIKSSDIKLPLNINIKQKNICSQFNIRIIKNIKVEKSPKWLIDKISSYGFKSINNIVDVTNLVMLETGQPIHAFDYDKINQGNFNIRLARKNESIITLDGKERRLNNETIVIDDNKKIFDLSGIMGGYNSEIDKNTTTIALQSSIFNRINIRLASKFIKLTTDASYRFERGVDPLMCVYSNNLATYYLNKLLPNTINSKIHSINNIQYKPIKIKYNYHKINNLIGIDLSEKSIINILKRLGINTVNKIAQIPSYRSYDIGIWQDLAEEVARIYGYNNIGKNIINESIGANIDDKFNKIQLIKDSLVKHGFDEIKSYSFVEEKLIKLLDSTNTQKIDFDKIQKVTNSIAPEISCMRPSLIPSLLTAVSKNPWAPQVNIFELGKVFYNFKEFYQLGITTTIKKASNISNVLKDLNIKSHIIKIDKTILNFLKIRKPVSLLICNIDKININKSNYNIYLPDTEYKAVSQFPPTIRDLSIIVDKDINNTQILNTIKKSSKNILIVEIFDEYISDKLGKNKKSLAFHIWLQDIKKPLDKITTNNIIKNILKILTKKHHARLR